MTVDSAYYIERYKAHSGLVYPFTTESIGDAAMQIGTVDPVGNCVALNIGTDYQLEFGYRSPIFSRGRVILTVALATGWELAVERRTPRESDTIFDDSKDFPSEEYEHEIDTITFMLQELEGSLCDCRYIDPETGLPPVGPAGPDCVPLLSSTGIFNTDGGEATPIEGETLTLGVGVSGTGPYTYQWKVDAVDVVGATSLTFDYLVITNVSITVQVTNACSTVLVGPYEVVTNPCYDCNALATEGLEAGAYWPMTDPMVPAPGASRYFHAGDTYGPYTAGGLGLYRLAGDVHPVLQGNTATIAFADFNYCEDDVIGTYDHWTESNLPSSGGYELRRGGVTVRPVFDFFGSGSHILVGTADFNTFYIQARFTFVGAERTNDSTQMWTGITMGVSDITVTLNRGSGTSPSTTVAHDIDTTKPYVVTTTLSNVWTLGNPSSTAHSTTTISQPGATTVSISLTNVQQYGEINVTEILNGTGGTASINFATAGGSVSWLGISYNSSAKLLEGLARNYEDYVCP